MSTLRDLSTLDYHPISEKLTEIMKQRVGTSEEHYFHVLVGYYLAKVASTMRCNVELPGGKVVPVNLYSVNLAQSGFGKGKSQDVMEDEVIKLFQEQFVEDTYPAIAETQIYNRGCKRAGKRATDPDDEVERVRAEFEGKGGYLFSFDSGTAPALKQFREQLLISEAGSINFEVDEIGSNLLGNMEMFPPFLELYDKGKIKSKLIKHTNDNKRGTEITGQTPANMLIFGTASRLLNGSKTEDEFYSLLDTGYARRCFFAYVKDNHKNKNANGATEVAGMKSQAHSQFLCDLSDTCLQLADRTHFRKKLVMEDAVAIPWMDYKIHCENRALDLPEHDEIRKAEMNHRYWKVMKLAGAYAFLDQTYNITEDHLYHAIKVAEESGKSLDRIMARDRAPVKLAKYLAQAGREVTQYELMEDLPFYKGSVSQKQDMMTMAIAWGYKNNVVIKKSFVDGIEFLSGESLQETDLDQMIFSYSDHIAYNYMNEFQAFDDLHKVTQAQGFHWVSHHVTGGHRAEECVMEGFNMVVIDVDGGCSLSTAKLLLKDYKAMYYTTKRHTEQENRFRIILPLNYTLKLDADDFKEFMQNIFDWLPFGVDDQTGQRARKWLSHSGHHEYNDGQLLDVLEFIPRTSKNERRQEQVLAQANLNNLERWFVNNTGEGNRSNQLHRYARLLVDAGHSYDQVEEGVKSLNDKLPNKLKDAEIQSTIMKTAAKKIIERDSNKAA